MEKWLWLMQSLCALDSLYIEYSPMCIVLLSQTMDAPSPSVLPGDSKMLMTALSIINLLFFKLRFLVIFFSFPYFPNFIFISMGHFSSKVTQRKFGIVEIIPCD